MPIGIPPNNGFAEPDGNWLNGLAGGHNLTFKNGITAIGTNQVTAQQLPDRVAVLEIDTSASGTGVALPPALQGMNIFVINNTANSVVGYPSIANNPVTGTQDTFNAAATSFSLTAHAGFGFTCGKDGLWFTN